MGSQRVIGYVRISRDTDDSTSVARQREVIESTARARGWELVGIAEDVDVSATKARLDRPGLSHVRREIAQGRADAVLCWRLDRLARSVVDMGTLLDEGLQVISATEPLDTTSPMGRAMVEILQVFAALESSTIGLRVRSARDYLARNARHPGGAAPYGYRSVPHPSGQGRALEIDSTEAAHIRAAADVVLDGGSLYRALQVIRDRGAKPRKAAEWSLSSLRVVLTGDAALGRLRHRGALVRDDDGLPVTPWEPVLPLADVERLRALLAPKKDPSERRRRATRLLSGLVGCSTCGGNMRVSTSTQSNGSRVVRYSCKGGSDGRGCTAPASVTAPLLEEFVEHTFLTVAGSMPVTEVVETLRDVPELAEVEMALRELSAAMVLPGADVPALAAKVASLAARRDELAAVPAEPVRHVVESGETFAQRWAREDVAGRRALLGDALRGIELTPGQRGRKGLDASRVTLRWREPGTAALLSDYVD